MKVIVSKSEAFDGPLVIFEPPCDGAYPYIIDVTEDIFGPLNVWVIDIQVIEELFDFIVKHNCVSLKKFKWNKSYYHIEIMEVEEEEF